MSYGLQQAVAEVDTQRGKFLTFLLDNEIYGIEIKHVIEIIGMAQINRMPEAPDYIKGVINLRKKIIPVIDMRIKLKIEPVPYDERTCIIIVSTDNIVVGLIIDQVAEVTSILDENIAPLPDSRSGVSNRYIFGIENSTSKVKLLLDCNKLFADEEVSAIEAIN
jgi:purine-binding chemotaxis protein CheW